MNDFVWIKEKKRSDMLFSVLSFCICFEDLQFSFILFFLLSILVDIFHNTSFIYFLFYYFLTSDMHFLFHISWKCWMLSLTYWFLLFLPILLMLILSFTNHWFITSIFSLWKLFISVLSRCDVMTVIIPKQMVIVIIAGMRGFEIKNSRSY